MGFSRQEYGSRLTCRPPGDLPYPGIKPESLKSPALADGLFTTSNTYTACLFYLGMPSLLWQYSTFHFESFEFFGVFFPSLVYFLFFQSALVCLLCSLASVFPQNFLETSATSQQPVHNEKLWLCYRGLWIRLNVSTKHLYTKILTTSWWY